MQLKRKGWQHDLWLFSSLFSRGKGKGKYVHLEVYMRRVTLGVVYAAYVLALHWIGWLVLYVAIRLPAFVFSLALNMVTIPTGLGVSVLYPGSKFLKIPFEIEWKGKHRSLAWILVPLEVVIANLWVVFARHPIDRLVLNLVWALSVVAVIGFVLGIKFVNTTSSHLIEFVD